MLTRCLMLFLAAGVALSVPAGESAPLQFVAEAHGLKDFHQVKRLAYTFNVKKPGLDVSRSWVWEPHSGRITCQRTTPSGEVEKTTYNRKAGDHLADDQLKQVDQWFVNDQFWLLFPLHVAWDASVSVQDKGIQDLPLGPGKARAYEVRYPEAGGYTPGDIYEIFVNREGQIQEWIFRKGGQAQPSLVARWTDYKRFGPLAIALDHTNADGSFRLWFTGVQVDTR